jgi:hypothetical protein
MKFETFHAFFVLYEDAAFLMYVWAAILNGTLDTGGP